MKWRYDRDTQYCIREAKFYEGLTTKCNFGKWRYKGGKTIYKDVKPYMKMQKLGQGKVTFILTFLVIFKL